MAGAAAATPELEAEHVYRIVGALGEEETMDLFKSMPEGTVGDP